MVASSHDISKTQVIDYLAGIIGFAERSADLTVAYMDGIGLRENGPKLGVPNQFCEEVGAIMQIARWERAGFSDRLPSELPSASEAETSMWDRINASPSAYISGTSGTDLAKKAFRTWLVHFAPAGLEELAEDILMSGSCDDDPLETIAEFLWQFQHLVTGEDEDA